jgi:hypothetical protein
MADGAELKIEQPAPENRDENSTELYGCKKHLISVFFAYDKKAKKYVIVDKLFLYW